MADLSLAQALAKPGSIQNVVFLYGSDAALVDAGAQSALGALRSRFRGATVDDLPLAALLSDPARLLDALATRSLFDDPAITVVPDLTERGAKLVSTFLSDLADAPENAGFLFASASLKSKSKLLDAARRHPATTVISCYDHGLDRAALRQRLQSAGIRVTDATAEDRLLDLFENADLGRIDRSIVKLALYARGDEPLTIADIDACIAMGDPAGLDMLTEALLEGRREALLAEVASRLRLGEDPAQITAMFGRLLQDLASGAAALDGESGGRKPFWKTEKLLKSARRMLPDLRARLERSLVAVHELEKRLRTSPAMPDVEIERLVLALSVLLAPTRKRRDG